MVSLCIGVLAGIAAIALGVLVRVAEKDRPEPNRTDLLTIVNAISLVAAFMFGMTLSPQIPLSILYFVV